MASLAKALGGLNKKQKSNKAHRQEAVRSSRIEENAVPGTVGDSVKFQESKDPAQLLFWRGLHANTDIVEQWRSEERAAGTCSEGCICSKQVRC